MYISEGTQVRYIHRAITAWLTHAATIRDAARQALVVNHDRHFDDIAWEEDRYLPHVGAASLLATSPHHLEKQPLGLVLP